jgi:hypothetical protein
MDVAIATGASSWAEFDQKVTDLVDGKIDFQVFAKIARSDIERLARAAMRRRRPPSWYGLDDLVGYAMARGWHHLFERRCQNGAIGFDRARYRNAGSYLRLKLKFALAKELSRVRGENQHTRSGPARAEYLSREGEIPEIAVDANAESQTHFGRQVHALMTVCLASRDFVSSSGIEKASKAQKVNCIAAFFLGGQAPEDACVQLAIWNEKSARRAALAVVESGILSA